jgi:hypothetical protein
MRRPDVAGQRRIVLEVSKKENSIFENIQRCTALSLAANAGDAGFD